MARFAAGLGGATDRRVALRYLQRLATKNETTSFFGPHQFGEVVPGEPDTVLAYDASSPRHGDRFSYLARYVVDELAAAAAAELADDPAAELVLHPLARLTGRGLHAGGRTVVLPAALHAALAAGPVAVATLLEPERTAAAKLRRAGLLVLPLRPAATSLTELEDLLASVRACDTPAADRWTGRLESIAAAVETVRRSPWPERRAACGRVAELLTGGTGAERAAGSVYTDRQPVYEEGVGGLRGLRLQRSALDRSGAALRAVLTAHAAYAAAVRSDARTWLRTGWDETGLPGQVSLYRLLDALAEREQPDYQNGSPAADALWERLDAVAPEDASLVEIGATQLTALFADVAPDEPFVCSPDLMLRGPRQQLVIGEVHHGMQPWCWLVRGLDPARRGLLRAEVGHWARELAGDATPLTLVEPRFTGKTFTLEYPGSALERVGRSALPREQALSLHQVVADRVTLDLAREDGAPLALMPTSPVSPLSRGFGRLVLWGPRTPPLRRHRPRVVVDGVVWFRESWRLGGADLTKLAAARDVTEAVLAAARLRASLGLPRFVYVKVGGEPKPIFVDLASAAYCDLLARLVAGRPDAVLTEMLPRPDDLALHCADGTFTAELRTAVLVRGAR